MAGAGAPLCFEIHASLGLLLTIDFKPLSGGEEMCRPTLVPGFWDQEVEDQGVVPGGTRWKVWDTSTPLWLPVSPSPGVRLLLPAKGSLSLPQLLRLTQAFPLIKSLHI